MLRTCVGVVALAILFAACGGGSGGGSTPEATFETMKKAVTNKDWNGFFDCVAPSALEEQEKEFNEGIGKEGPEGDMARAMMAGMLGKEPDELKGMNFRDFMVAMMDKAVEMDPDGFAQVKDAVIVESKIDGDKAVLKVKTGDDTDDMEMMKVDGKWYLTEMPGN